MSTDTPKKRGIVDPWKVVSPLTPPPPKPVPTAAKTNLADMDFDADVRPGRSFVLRGKHASVEVNNNNLTNGNDGLRDLVKCLFEILGLDGSPALFEENLIGLRIQDRTFNLPAEGVAAASFACAEKYTGPAAAVFFHQQDVDQGLLRLVRILRTVQKRPGAAGELILKRWGVTPMLR